jgi:energy-coupling factor transporter ATP-binding protein EcfA2
MLISFAVTNVRSIKERLELSLIAAPRERCLPELLVPEHETESLGVRVLRTALLYGANASGKSNLLKALLILRQMVVFSATAFRPDQQTGAIPFLFDQESRTKPSVFELSFLLDGIRHDYRVVMDHAVVSEEELIIYPHRRPQRLFLRSRQADGKYELTPGSSWKGGKDLLEKTRPNALLLSVAAQFNHAQLSPIYQWFVKRIHYWDLSSADAHMFQIAQTAMLVHQHPAAKAAVERFLAQADLSITGVKTRAVRPEEIGIPAGQDLMADAMRGKAAAGQVIDTRFMHRLEGTGETVDLPLSEESVGTQRFFGLVGQLQQIIETGACIAIDEIDASLHPLLVHAIVRMLHDPEVNRNGAQAIITTHDTTLLNQEMVRRDQVWFTEKDKGQGTRLVPLTDFSPKQGEALQRGYLGGRYGGIPVLPGRLGA